MAQAGSLLERIHLGGTGERMVSNCPEQPPYSRPLSFILPRDSHLNALQAVKSEAQGQGCDLQ